MTELVISFPQNSITPNEKEVPSIILKHFPIDPPSSLESINSCQFCGASTHYESYKKYSPPDLSNPITIRLLRCCRGGVNGKSMVSWHKKAPCPTVCLSGENPSLSDLSFIYQQHQSPFTISHSDVARMLVNFNLEINLNQFSQSGEVRTRKKEVAPNKSNLFNAPAYKAIIASLSTRPMRHSEIIGENSNIPYNSINKFIRKISDLGMIKRLPNPDNRWCLEADYDKLFEETESKKKKNSPGHPVNDAPNLGCRADIIRALELSKKPMKACELSEFMCMNKSNVYAYLKKMVEDGSISVKKIQGPYRKTINLYSLSDTFEEIEDKVRKKKRNPVLVTPK